MVNLSPYPGVDDINGFEVNEKSEVVNFKLLLMSSGRLSVVGSIA